MVNVIRTRREAEDTMINTPSGTVTVAQLVDALQNLCDGECYTGDPERVARVTGCTDADSRNIARSLSVTDALWSIRS